MDYPTQPPHDEVTIRIDGNPQGEQPPIAEGSIPASPPSLEQDFYQKPVEEIQKLPLALKIHVAVGLGVSALCFLIWHFVTPGDPSTSIWWWMFPFFFFSITATMHHNFSQGPRYSASIPNPHEPLPLTLSPFCRKIL
jgi:hypothetical protein